MSSLTTRAFAASVAAAGLVLCSQVAASAFPAPRPLPGSHVAVTLQDVQTVAVTTETQVNSAARQGVLNKIHAAALRGINFGSG